MMLPKFTKFASIITIVLICASLLVSCGYKTKPVYVEKSSKKAK